MNQYVRSVVDRIPFISRLRERIRARGGYPAGHYHSTIPSKQEVSEGALKLDLNLELSDIDLNSDVQLSILEEVAKFYCNIPFTQTRNNKDRYYLNNGWFNYTDGVLLYCFLRYLEPRKVIEIGSGFSSALILDTLDYHPHLQIDLTFIDPNPERLKSILNKNDNNKANIISEKIQQVELQVFDELEAGDILFVDSSHVLKFQSDLHRIMFEILPRLPVGVYVHFHDIFYPFEYPANWLIEGRYWNEVYVLRAFLAGNTSWEVSLFSHYANLRFPKYMIQNMPLCREDFGSSLYIKKVS